MRIVLIGAGGHGKVVIATARAAGYEVVRVLDDDPGLVGTDFCGLRVEGPILSVIGKPENSAVVIGIGDNRVRAGLSAALDLRFATIVHPFSWLAPDVVLGEGTVVFAGSVVNSNARIGRHCVLNTSCSVDHDSSVGDFGHVAPGARLAGSVVLGEGACAGMGATVLPGVALGAWSMAGAGSVVVRDVPPGAVVMGVPARPKP